MLTKSPFIKRAFCSYRQEDLYEESQNIANVNQAWPILSIWLDITDTELWFYHRIGRGYAGSGAGYGIHKR